LANAVPKCFYDFPNEWHLQAMAIVLYLAITVENEYSKTTRTWVGIFLKYIIHFYYWILLPMGCRYAKQEEEYGDLGL